MRDVGFHLLPVSVVIDQIDIGDVLTFKLEDHTPVAGDRNRPLAARSPRRGCSRAPGSAMSDGADAVARAASTARNRHVLGGNSACVAP
jgi:hypothetical protein